MFRAKLSVVCACLLAIGASILTGCSTNPVDRTAGMSPNSLYSEAKDEMTQGQWDKAVPLLEKLEAKAALALAAKTEPENADVIKLKAELK